MGSSVAYVRLMISQCCCTVHRIRSRDAGTFRRGLSHFQRPYETLELGESSIRDLRIPRSGRLCVIIIVVNGGFLCKLHGRMLSSHGRTAFGFE
jgi:hypothetical protein